VRYFFVVKDRVRTIEDEEGTVLSNPEAAMLQAAIVAAELADDGEAYHGCVVHVIDEQGNEIGKVPVATRH
jgi:hypothetical protein